MEFWRKRFRSSSGEESPYTAAAIAAWRVGADGVASLEGEVFLDIGEGRVVVVFNFAELEEAKVDFLVLMCSATSNG
jgi:hypothetical protein